MGGDSWGDYKTPCPRCGGVVEWWFFGADCRGNGSSGGIACKKCKKSFTRDEWKKVAKKELAAHKREIERLEREFERKEKAALKKIRSEEQKKLRKKSVIKKRR